MYELNRILLRNFGPRDARYEDVPLDFSGAGAPVESASLIPDAGHVSERPAPASLVMLQNGGGKGVLLTGIMCTTIPHHHNDLETLRDFVVSLAQPSHVVLEWADARTGRLLVTAQVLAPDGQGNLHRLFYSFHPSAALDADRLPFHRDGHWLPFEDYCTELRDLKSRVEALELWIEEGQEKWERHQRGLGLQPDLFDIQRRMNAKESDAAAAFTTNSADAFVDWLLRKATDDDQYADLGSAFRTYSEANDQRTQWDKERQFAQVMHVACGEVGGLHQTMRDHTDAAEHAEKQLVAVTAALRLRHQQLSATAEEHSTTVNTTHRGLEGAKHSRAVAEERLRHVQRRTYTLELDAVAKDTKDTETQRKHLENKRAAWEEVPVALRHMQAVDNHSRAQQALTKAEQTAAPYVRAVDTAAAALRAGYAQAEATVREEIGKRQEGTQDTQRKIDVWRDHIAELFKKDGSAETETGTLQEQIQSFASDLAVARREGVVAADESAADAAARTDGHARHLGLLVEEAKRTRQLSRAERDQAHEAVAEKRQQELTSRNAATAADSGVSNLRARAETVRRNPMCAELLETHVDEVLGGDPLRWLDDHASVLTDLAQRRVRNLDGTTTRKRIDLGADQDLLSALDTSEGLLPAGKEVRGLCADLSAHGISAVPGWQWMRDNVPADEHRQVITAHPDLVGGIVVGGHDGLTEARRHLEQTRPWPATAIAVGTGERLLRLDSSGEDGRFVVEPTPAMHDEQAAARERAQVESRIAAVTGELHELEERLKSARDLGGQIANWQDACGDMPVPSQLERLEELQATAAEAKEALEAACRAANEQDTALAAAEEAYEGLIDEAQTARQTAGTLARLTLAETTADQAQARIAALAAESEARQRDLNTLRNQCAQAEQEILRHARAIEAAEQQAHGYAQARTEITATPEAQEAQAALGVPPEPLTVLQHRYRQARGELLGMEVGEDHQQRASEAQQALLDSQEKWGKISEEVQRLAQEFSCDARAGNKVQRHAVLRDLAAQIHGEDKCLQQLRDRESRLKARAESLTSTTVAPRLTDEDIAAWTPASLDEARTLTAGATSEYDTAQKDERTAAEEFNNARRNQNDSDRERSAFDRVLALLESTVHGLSIPAAQAPYQGTAEAAETSVRQATTVYGTSRTKAQQTERDLDRSVNRLKEEAANVRFEGLDIPLRTQISALNGRQIPAMAETWAEALRSRIAALTTDLEGMAKTREALASQLRGHVSDLLQRLDQASRFSAFPDGDTPWAGQKFLTIRYKKPDLSVLAAQMRETVDTLARNPRTRKFKGIDVVMRCLKDAVPRGFTAEVMKPNATQRVERVPVEKMGKVFSGGQELTGAILLYCALAALRTSPGPRSRTRNGGLLLLDNPIGRANAGYLVDIQLEMAAALGIQLIYTTGLSDEAVTSRFPMHIQLRNDAEARSGLSLIRLEERVRRALVPAPRIASDDEKPEPSGYLTSARLYFKQDNVR
ncbi:hypothetical protein AB0D46_11405 [Streptomyces sp. NPDC048383]|uniref:hypothetical protein n=1 Tax=Streptomyces sp. NPDC048383 TaxID=3155386 RepID=UPI0034167388